GHRPGPGLRPPAPGADGDGGPAGVGRGRRRGGPPPAAARARPQPRVERPRPAAVGGSPRHPPRPAAAPDRNRRPPGPAGVDPGHHRRPVARGRLHRHPVHGGPEPFLFVVTTRKEFDMPDQLLRAYVWTRCLLTVATSTVTRRDERGE